MVVSPHSEEERGELGLSGALLAVALLLLVAGLLVPLVDGFERAPLESAQIKDRIDAGNVGVDLAAISAFDPKPLVRLGGAPVTIAPVPLPAITPFGTSPSAAPLPSTTMPAYALVAPTYDPTTRTLSGSVAWGASQTTISITQSAPGTTDCSPYLAGASGTGC
jgi:hypothetical protein